MGSIELLTGALVSLWVFAGRGITLAGCMRVWRPESRPCIALSVGLILTPVAAAVIAGAGGGFLSLLMAFVTIDILLIAVTIGLLTRVETESFHFESVKLLGPILFGSLCAILALRSGPYVETLTDAWWHMRHASQYGMSESLIPQTDITLVNWGMWLKKVLAIDASSYRLQAFIVWLTGSSMLEAWYFSTISVSCLIGISFYMLSAQMTRNRSGHVAALFSWLVILGGMNTGLRLVGWPAGMGYVFLNIGLLGLWFVWGTVNYKRHGICLFALCMTGAAFYHLGEMFLLLVAASSLLLIYLAFRYTSRLSHFLFVCAIIGVGIVSLTFAGMHKGVPPSLGAYLPTVLLCGAVLVSSYFAHRSSRYLRNLFILLSTLILVFLVIDWGHVLELFRFNAIESSLYYDKYIPEYKSGLARSLVFIPSWDHQLRASILWSGIAALIVSSCLWYRDRSRQSGWLAVLCIVPCLLLISPPLFTLLGAAIPVYGGYRVQFLIPVALVFGVVVERTIRAFHSESYPQRQTERALFSICSLVCAVTLVPDLLTRTDLMSSRPWAVLPNTAFHWRFEDNRKSLETHTSWRYQQDIDRIEKLFQSESKSARVNFLSDLATSYYVGAETGSSPVFQQEHHSRSSHEVRDLLSRFCDPTNNDVSEMKHTMVELGITHVVINRDQRNYTAEYNGRSCVGHTDHLSPKLGQLATKSYEGKYLDLWNVSIN